MPTVIDAFIVELGLDPSGFDKEEKKIAERLAGFKNRSKKEAKDAEDFLSDISVGFEKLVRDTAAFIGSIIGLRALTTFAKDVIETNRQLGIMADVTQESVQRLSALGNVFERMGGSSKGVLNIISAWDAEMKAMQIGAMDPNSSRLVRLLNSLTAVGVQVERTEAGKVRKPFDLFVEIAEKVSKANASADVKTALLRAAGLDDETIAVMLRGGEATRAYLKEQEKIYQITPEQREKTDRLNRAWAELTQRAKGLGQDGLIFLVDGFDKLVDAMKRMFNFLNETFTDPKSPLYLPSMQAIKEYFSGEIGKPGEGGKPATGGVSGQGATGGTVHGHQVDPYGGLSGKELYDPVSGTMGGGVGGHSAMFGAGQHEGVDIMTPVGTAVHASRSGKIIRAPRPDGGLDQVMIIDHGDGTFSRYLHQGPSKVKAGDHVEGGQVIGSSGYRNAAHTHFEMWEGVPSGRGSRLINPKVLYGWDKDNPAIGGRRTIGRGPGSNDEASKGAAGGIWDSGAPPMQFKSPVSLRSPSIISNTKTDISTVNVHSQASDAAAIAGDIARELKRQMLPSQQFINAKNPAEANAAMLAAEQARQQAEAR